MRRVTWVGRVIEECDPFVDDISVRGSEYRAAVVHPASAIAEDRRFANSPFAVGQLSTAEVSRQILGHAHRKEPEVRLTEFKQLGRGTERRLEFDQRFVGTVRVSRFTRENGDDQFLFEQLFRIVTVEPAELHGHHGLFVAIVVGDPFLLADARGRRVPPEVDPEDFVVREPDRLMVIVIWRTRVSHASQTRPGRSIQREEEGARIARPEMPAKSFATVDDERGTVVGEWHDLAARDAIRHGGAFGIQTW